jgi:hypothetical protein
MYYTLVLDLKYKERLVKYIRKIKINYKQRTSLIIELLFQEFS